MAQSDGKAMEQSKISCVATHPSLHPSLPPLLQLQGYGFITPEDGSDDVFLHQTQIRRVGFRFVQVRGKGGREGGREGWDDDGGSLGAWEGLVGKWILSIAGGEERGKVLCEAGIGGGEFVMWQAWGRIGGMEGGRERVG